MELVGYHGTDILGARKIDEEFFDDSPLDAWLGSGVYFFEDVPNLFDGKENAKWWVEKVKHFENWVIFKANIISENVFDMVSNKNDQDKFNLLYEKLLKKHIESGRTKDSFNAFTVFQMINRYVEVIRTVVDAKKYCDNSNRSYVNIRPQIQLCVCRNSAKVIRNVEHSEVKID